MQRDHRLSDPVGHGGHTEDSRSPTVWLRYLHCPHRRRKVRPRGHPIPDLVQIALQISFEVLDRLPVHPGRALLRLDRLYASQTSPFEISNDLTFGSRLAHSISSRDNARLLAQTNQQIEPIAVGTALTGGPPHRSQRALLTHWAPASGSGVEAYIGVGMQDAGGWEPSCRQAVHPIPVQAMALAAAT